jgi:hypothetical protein
MVDKVEPVGAAGLTVSEHQEHVRLRLGHASIEQSVIRP